MPWNVCIVKKDFFCNPPGEIKEKKEDKSMHMMHHFINLEVHVQG